MIYIKFKNKIANKIKELMKNNQKRYGYNEKLNMFDLLYICSSAKCLPAFCKATEMTKIIYNGKIILTNTLLTPQYYIYLSLHIQRFYQIKMQQKQ